MHFEQLMFYLGLLLPICFIPGVTGASIPTQWAVLSLALIPCVWRKAALPSLPLYLGLGFVAWATLGLLWSPNIYDSIWGLWIVSLLSGSLWLGYTTTDPHPLLRGLAIGLTVSSFIAIFQAFGYSPVPVFSQGTPAANIAGLLYNRTVLGAFSALLILCLIYERLWWYIPSLIPGFILSGSRGGWLIFTIGLISHFGRRWALVATIIATIVLAWAPPPSDTLRLQIWAVAIQGLTCIGWGPGSFNTVYIFLGQKSAIHAEYVHNDYLQLWFEYGFMALAPISILALAYLWRPHPTLFAFAILAGFYFPLSVPLTAFLGLFLAGHSLRGFSLDGLIIRRCRPDLLSRAGDYPAEFDPAWSEAVPLQSRT